MGLIWWVGLDEGEQGTSSVLGGMQAVQVCKTDDISCLNTLSITKQQYRAGLLLVAAVLF